MKLLKVLAVFSKLIILVSAVSLVLLNIHTSYSKTTPSNYLAIKKEVKAYARPYKEPGRKEAGYFEEGTELLVLKDYYRNEKYYIKVLALVDDETTLYYIIEPSSSAEDIHSQKESSLYEVESSSEIFDLHYRMTDRKNEEIKKNIHSDLGLFEEETEDQAKDLKVRFKLMLSDLAYREKKLPYLTAYTLLDMIKRGTAL